MLLINITMTAFKCKYCQHHCQRQNVNLYRLAQKTGHCHKASNPLNTLLCEWCRFRRSTKTDGGCIYFVIFIQNCDCVERYITKTEVTTNFYLDWFGPSDATVRRRLFGTFLVWRLISAAISGQTLLWSFNFLPLPTMTTQHVRVFNGCPYAALTRALVIDLLSDRQKDINATVYCFVPFCTLLKSNCTMSAKINIFTIVYRIPSWNIFYVSSVYLFYRASVTSLLGNMVVMLNVSLKYFVEPLLKYTKYVVG